MKNEEYVCSCGHCQSVEYINDFWVCPRCHAIWSIERYEDSDLYICENPN